MLFIPFRKVLLESRQPPEKLVLSLARAVEPRSIALFVLPALPWSVSRQLFVGEIKGNEITLGRVQRPQGPVRVVLRASILPTANGSLIAGTLNFTLFELLLFFAFLPAFILVLNATGFPPAFVLLALGVFWTMFVGMTIFEASRTLQALDRITAVEAVESGIAKEHVP